MVTRKRLRAALTAIALYIGAALVIGYFGVNAYTGARGLNAKQDLLAQMEELKVELAALKTERAELERRVGLLRGDRLDPDMPGGRARALLRSAPSPRPTRQP